MGYHIKSTSVSYEGNQRVAWVELTKHTPSIFFWRTENQPMRHKVYFDLYDPKATHKIYDGFATIDQDWCKLTPSKRNEIVMLLQKHFHGEYYAGNFRTTLKKV